MCVTIRLGCLLSCLVLLHTTTGWCASTGTQALKAASKRFLTVAQARTAVTGRTVRLADKVVTAGTDQMQNQSFFYVQEAGVGIRVRSRMVVHQGDRVTVEGALRWANDAGGATSGVGEREIDATSVVVTYGPNTMPAPMVLSSRKALLSAADHNVGSYVETSGTVVLVDDSNRFFYINNGSDACSAGRHPGGGESPKGIRILAPPKAPLAGLLNKTVAIQGIIGSVAAPAAGAPPSTPGSIPVIRPCCEKFLDYNMNGFWDRGEPYIDMTRDGAYDGIRVAGIAGPAFTSRFDDYGTLIVRGRAFMPKGLYCNDVSPSTLDAAVAQGFNEVQHHGRFSESLADLNARNLKTFPLLGSSSEWPAWLAVLSNTAIAGWYLHDEPEWHGIGPAQALSDLNCIRSKDPGHVIGESHADLNQMGGYGASDEVTWMDRYPIGNAAGKFGIPTIWDFDWTCRGAHGNDPYYPVWQYVQMFEETPNFTIPTVPQFRAMVFMGMASYVKGYFYFSYQQGGAAWQALWAEVRNINRQMDALRTFLVLPWTPLDVTSSNPTWVKAGGYRVGNSFLLVVVNGDDVNFQTATITLPGAPDDSRLTAPIGGRGVTLTGRAFTRTFSPCEVRVLMYGGMPRDP